MPAHYVHGIFATEETENSINNQKPKTMKNMKRIMLIAFVALMMIPMPQQAVAKERIKVQVEKRDKRPQRKPVMLRAMRNDDFSMVYKIVKNTSFDKNKIDIIRVACIGSNFSSRQCAKLLSLLSFDDNKLDALKVMAPRLVDVEDYDKIIKQFSFSSNREKAMKILSRR